MADGGDALIFSCGPVMLHEALVASEILSEQGLGLRVVNMPWLNRVDRAWLAETIKPHRHVYALDDHAPVGGLGDAILNALATAELLAGRRFTKLAVEGYAAWGTPPQVLKHHGLDGESIAAKIKRDSEG